MLDDLPLTRRVARQVVLAAAICICIGLLAYFKYASCLIGLFSDLIGYKIPSDSQFSALDIILPIGISFYTFQSLSYSIDVYRGQQTAERSLTRFALFIGFFPQLIAGPIVRANQFFYQLSRKRSVRWSVFMEGCYLIVRGLFLKLVIADNLGQIVDRYWKTAARPDAPATLALSLVVFFSCQIFCDFAGYTDIARGIAYQLGFRLPVNFNAPYLARTFSDFWRRWHITLSEWIKDYLYIPLGGRRGSRLRTGSNLLVVMMLSGLWHGAGLNFILWGLLHGLAIAVERITGLPAWLKSQKPSHPAVSMVGLAWFLVVQSTWIIGMAFFRAADSSEAWLVLQHAVSGIAALPVEGVAYPKSNGLIVAAWWFTLPVWLIHFRAYLYETFSFRQSVYERTFYFDNVKLG
ncbi:MAG: MBOAT family protein, partial [bacterium]|nr:MBOAT family protein [bacterium]